MGWGAVGVRLVCGVCEGMYFILSWVKLGAGRWHCTLCSDHSSLSRHSRGYRVVRVTHFKKCTLFPCGGLGASPLPRCLRALRLVSAFRSELRNIVIFALNLHLPPLGWTAGEPISV